MNKNFIIFIVYFLSKMDKYLTAQDINQIEIKVATAEKKNNLKTLDKIYRRNSSRIKSNAQNSK